MAADKGEHSPATEDVKAKFRAALDKKKAHGGADVTDRSGRSKVAGTHDAESSTRMFRRKAGG